MYQGFFINLSRNQERRQSLLQHLEEIGAAARYQRFEAVDGRAVAHLYNTTLQPGALGLWLSDLNLLGANRSPGLHLHIIEDDSVFARDAVGLFDRTLEHADARLSHWDLIFTDIHVPADIAVFHLLFERMRQYWQTKNLALVDLEHIGFAGTSSFFINKHSVAKLAGLLSEKWTTGVPIDLYLRHLVGQKALKAYVTVPFLTSISRHNLESDIRGGLDRSRAVWGVYRRGFFKEASFEALLGEMEELTREVKVSPLAALYLRALTFTMSDQWVPF
jgi:GR25 family glycosyltransferase involved in LPS biosynthesis